MNPSFSIVIPALNEAQTITRALDEVTSVFASIGQPYEIIVVDDGSTDGTGETVAAFPDVRLVRHAANRGKGAAVRTGALASQGEWVLFLDVDLAVTPETFKRFLPHLETSDVLMGSRRVPGARIMDPQPWARDMLGRLFNVVVRVLFSVPYHDTQCGFKAFRLSTSRPLFEALETAGWSFDVELLLRARKAGLRIQELPVEWHDGPKSRFRPRHALEVVRELWALWG